MKVLRTIDKLYGNVLTSVDAFTAFIIFILMLLITSDVVSRAVFNHPFQGVAEIVSNSIIILCFLEIPYVLMKGTHVRTTMLYDKVSPRTRAIIDVIASLIGILVFSLIIYSSWGNMLRTIAIRDAEIAGSVRIPTAPGRIAIIIGSAMMILEFLLLGIKNAIRIKNPDAFDDEKQGKNENATPEGGNAI